MNILSSRFLSFAQVSGTKGRAADGDPENPGQLVRTDTVRAHHSHDDRVVQHIAEVARQLDLPPEQQRAQLLETRIERHDAGRLGVDPGIDVPGQLS